MKVFFSYKCFTEADTEKRQVVEAVKKAFEDRKDEVQIDYQFMRLGDGIREHITEALHASDAVVFFICSEALKSEWIEMEAYIAYAKWYCYHKAPGTHKFEVRAVLLESGIDKALKERVAFRWLHGLLYAESCSGGCPQSIASQVVSGLEAHRELNGQNSLRHQLASHLGAEAAQSPDRYSKAADKVAELYGEPDFAYNTETLRRYPALLILEILQLRVAGMLDVLSRFPKKSKTSIKWWADRLVPFPVVSEATGEYIHAYLTGETCSSPVFVLQLETQWMCNAYLWRSVYAYAEPDRCLLFQSDKWFTVEPISEPGDEEYLLRIMHEAIKWGDVPTHWQELAQKLVDSPSSFIKRFVEASADPIVFVIHATFHVDDHVIATLCAVASRFNDQVRFVVYGSETSALPPSCHCGRKTVANSGWDLLEDVIGMATSGSAANTKRLKDSYEHDLEILRPKQAGVR